MREPQVTQNYHNFEWTEDHATVFLKWTDFSSLNSNEVTKIKRWKVIRYKVISIKNIKWKFILVKIELNGNEIKVSVSTKKVSVPELDYSFGNP